MTVADGRPKSTEQASDVDVAASGLCDCLCQCKSFLTFHEWIDSQFADLIEVSEVEPVEDETLHPLEYAVGKLESVSKHLTAGSPLSPMLASQYAKCSQGFAQSDASGTSQY